MKASMRRTTTTTRTSGEGKRCDLKPAALARRVFISAPRTFSFSHRSLCSLRHPYLSLVSDLVEDVPAAKRVEAILELLLDATKEKPKWTRVGAVFDAKVNAEELDKKRAAIVSSPAITSQIEVLWNRLGGAQNTFLTNDVYRQFHVRLYAVILATDDVSLTAATIATVNEDYAYDARDFAGVSFGSFALSMLEVADNWTKTRAPTDYEAFFERIIDSLDAAPHRTSSSAQAVSSTIPGDGDFGERVFFSGGLLVKHHAENHVQYSKVPM